MSEPETLRFEVVGSTGVVYDVTASKHGDGLTLSCTCDAGRVGTACKHRLALLAGDATAIRTGTEGVATLCGSWLPGTALAEALANVETAETHADAAKRKLASAKKALSRVMGGG